MTKLTLSTVYDVVGASGGNAAMGGANLQHVGHGVRSDPTRLRTAVVRVGGVAVRGADSIRPHDLGDCAAVGHVTGAHAIDVLVL